MILFLANAAAMLCCCMFSIAAVVHHCVSLWLVQIFVVVLIALYDLSFELKKLAVFA